MHLTILVWKHASSGPTWAYIHVTECLCQQQYMYRLIGPTTQPEKVVRSGSAACDMADRQSAKVLKKASSPPREGSTLSWQYKGGGGGGCLGEVAGGERGGRRAVSGMRMEAAKASISSARLCLSACSSSLLPPPAAGTLVCHQSTVSCLQLPVVQHLL